MSSTLSQILRLEVPIIVRVGERTMPLADVLSLIPGTIIQIDKGSEEELDLLVNNRKVGSGAAVKIGENFGLRVTHIGDANERLAAAEAELIKAGETSGPPPSHP